MPTTPMCQSNCPSTMTKSFCDQILNLTNANDLLRHATLNLLPFTIFAIEILSQRQRPGQIVGEQQMQRFLGVSSAPPRSDAGQLKPDLVSAELGRTLRHCLSAASPGRCVVLSRCKPAETRIRFSPVTGPDRQLVPSATGQQRATQIPPRRQTNSRPRLSKACAQFDASREQSSVKVGQASCLSPSFLVRLSGRLI